MDKLASMRTFVRIVELGSLTAAASELGTSLPTVVRALAALERQLGVLLLKRTTRRLHLTDEGTRYLQRCRLILSAVQEADDLLVSRGRELQGKLSVTASVEFGRRYVSPVLTRFLVRHPRVSAELLLLDHMVGLVEEGIDVAVRIAHLKDSSLVAVPVGMVRRVCCGSEPYLRCHGTPETPADVKGHRCIRHTVLAPRNDWQFRVGHRKVTVPISPVLVTNNIESALDACLDGLGLGVFLSYMVAPYVRAGQLSYVLERYEPEPIPVQIVYSSSKLISNTVRFFIDEFAGELKHVKFD